MPRPPIEIPNKTKKSIESTLGELKLADQLVPLMFDKDHMAVLLSLLCANDAGGLSFTLVSKVAGLGRSQKLVDTLSHLIDYGLVEKLNGNYKLTDYGISAARFAEKFIRMINSDPQVARKRSELAGNISIIKAVEQKYNEQIKMKVKEAT